MPPWPDWAAGGGVSGGSEGAAGSTVGGAPTSSGTPDMAGLYVQVYPSTLENASRMRKVGASVHRGCGFTETHLVGVARLGLGSETVAPGLSIVRVKGTGRQGNLGRLLRAVLWQPRVFWRYRKQPVTVVAAHQVYVLPLCWLLSKATGAALVYNPHELETETPTMRGVKQWVARRIERRLIGRCQVVSTVNDAIADWYAETYPEISRPVVATNVPLVRAVDVGLRERLGVTDDDMLYIHTGNLVRGRNIPLILAAFAQSPHHVVFLGDGFLRASVTAAAAERPNIHWLPPVATDLVTAHVREADVGLCLIETEIGLSYRLSSPNKFLESLAVGVPALCSDLPYARGLLGPEVAAKWLLRDPEADLPGALARIGKEDVAAFGAAWDRALDWDAEAAELVEAYRSLVRQAATR